MHFLIKIVIVSIFIFLHVDISAQKYAKQADMLFENRYYIESIKQYKEGATRDPKTGYYDLKIAAAYLELNQLDSAMGSLHLAFKKEKNPTADYFITKGKVLQLSHDFDEAQSVYKEALKMPTPYEADLKKRIEECTYGKAYLKKPVNVSIKNLGDTINSTTHDVLPKITADMSTLYFTSHRAPEKTHIEKIYTSRRSGTKWMKPTVLSAPINSTENIACVSISSDGNSMYLFKGVNHGDLYESSLISGEWTEPEPLFFNTIEHRESSMCISADQKELFFVRKSKNGNGQIYHCERTSLDAEWSIPKPLPPTINSPYDEESPFLHPDGKTLYFSSKGHSSMGGYDIFKSTRNNNRWSVPVNLGYPINTAGDELGFVIAANGTTGYYSSAKQAGIGGQDIYSISFEKQHEKDSPKLTLITGFVKNKQDSLALEAKISVIDLDANTVVTVTRSQKKEGSFLLTLPSGKNYGFIVDKEGFLFHSENVFVAENTGYREIRKEIYITPKTLGTKVVLNNIFFETGSAVLNNRSENQLQKLYDFMINNPDLKIEIAGHTDNVGNDASNLILSQKRAEAVADYLIKKNIANNRIQAKGFGSSKPIADNNSETGREKNRRTEFMIIE